MSTFRGRAPSGLINRETGNYAYLGENGENPVYFKNTSSADSTASVASTSDIKALFS